MPVYTYRCENCGIQIERHQKYTDQSLTRCPECNKKALRKVISPVRIVFKGSGFYSTDHQSPSGQKRSPSSKTESSTESPKEVKEIKETKETKDSTPAKSKSDSSE